MSDEHTLRDLAQINRKLVREMNALETQQALDQARIEELEAHDKEIAKEAGLILLNADLHGGKSKDASTAQIDNDVLVEALATSRAKIARLESRGIEDMKDTILTLETQLAERGKDTERLDWLDDEDDSCDSRSAANIRFAFDVWCLDEPSFRAAVDAARNAEQEGEG